MQFLNFKSLCITTVLIQINQDVAPEIYKFRILSAALLNVTPYLNHKSSGNEQIIIHSCWVKRIY